MRHALIGLALLLSVRCAANGKPVASGWAEPVVEWDGCIERVRCAGWAHYARPADEQWGPIYWLRAASGRACEVAPAVYTMVHRDELFTCDWRAWRP